MKDGTSTPTDKAGSSPNEFERRKPGMNGPTHAEAAIEEPQQGGAISVEAVRAADILSRKRTEQAVREGEERQAFLLKLTDALRPITDAREIQATTARMIGEHLGADRAMYGEVEGEKGAETGTIRGQYVRAGGRDETTVPFPEHFTFGQFGRHTMEARYRGEPLIVTDVQNDPDYSAEERAAWAQFGVRAAVVATLAKNGRLVAEFGVHSTTPREWTEAEIALIQECAERTWAAAERARAEEALRASEQKYRTLFEAMDEGYLLAEVLKDEETGVTDILYLEANPAAVRLAGRDFTGQRMRAIDPDYEEYWYELYDQVATTGRSERREHYAAPHGRWFELYLFKVGGAESRRVAAVFQDVTERKRAEIALRESEERQAFLLALGDATRAATTAEAKIEVAARMLGQRLNASRVLWAEYDWDRNLAHIFNGWFADGAQPFPTVMDLSDYEGEVLNQLKAGRTVRVDNVGLLTAEPAYAAIAKVGVQALLSPPLLVDGKLKFNVSIHQHEPRHWTDDEVALVEEVSERLWAEVVRARAEQALRASEEKYRALFESMDEAYAVVDVLKSDKGEWSDFRFVEVNPAFMEHTSMPYPVGKTATELLGTPNPRWAKLYGEALDSGKPLRVEESEPTLGLTFDLNIFSLDREKNRVAVLFTNITERKRAEQALQASERHAKTLLAELQHRVRNILAMIRSVARRTGETTETVEDYVQHLEGRISAMARTQALLTREVGAMVDLQNLILDELEMQAAQPGRYRLTGPDVSLPAKAAEVLGLALHELATNSIKYGALSSKDGRIDVRWALLEGDAAPQLSLIWSEHGLSLRGGARRSGFGTELITQRVPYELQGTGTLELRPSGLVATIEFPLEERSSVLQTNEGVQVER
jgi:two-component sensor histidine kinase/GAF domain-containing protein